MAKVLDNTYIKRGANVQVSTDLSVENCSVCGGTYALSRKYLENRKNEGGSWNCPYCKTSWHYSKNENERLKDEIKNQNLQLTYERQKKAEAFEKAERLRRSRDALKGVVTKERKKVARIEKGICPHCNRYFKNLHKHMQSKHEN